MTDYYQITLWVTFEQEEAIVRLYRNRKWIYSRADKDAVSDQQSSSMQTPMLVSQRVTDGNVANIEHAVKEGLRHGGSSDIDSDTENSGSGDGIFNYSFKVVKTEESLLGNDSNRLNMDDNPEAIGDDAQPSGGQLDIAVHEKSRINSIHLQPGEGNERSSLPYTDNLERPWFMKQIFDQPEVLLKTIQKQKMSESNKRIKGNQPSCNIGGVELGVSVEDTHNKPSDRIEDLSDGTSCDVDNNCLSDHSTVRGKCVSSSNDFPDSALMNKKSESKGESRQKDKRKVRTAKSCQNRKVYSKEERLKGKKQQLNCSVSGKQKTNKKAEIYCKDCGHLFKVKRNYERHLKTDRCRHDCAVCGKVFLYGMTAHYIIHMKHHNKQRDHECEVCGIRYINKYQLTQHMLKHTLAKPVICDRCGGSFASNNSLTVHVKNMHSKNRPVFQCSKCPKVFNSPSGLLYHNTHSHDPDYSKTFPCFVCGKVYKSQYICKMHEAIHKQDKDYKCDLCDAAFKRLNGLQQHKRRHSKDYKHFCKTCNRGFYTPLELVCHQNIHTGEKPFKCSICNYSCAHRVNLFKHKKVHTSENQT